MGRLIQQRFDGPLDVIGDIHGERQALETSLEKLGYDREGRHPDERRPVFVGDLCDRGPDSPGVIRIVQTLVESGRAQLVAGNHWFYGVAWHPEFGTALAISTAEQEPILSFPRSLPIALAHRDLRIVHAAWIEKAIAACRGLDVPLDEAYQTFDRALQQGSEFRAIDARYEEATASLRAALKDPAVPPTATAVGPYDEFCQMGNPIRVITSEVERVTGKPFFASGKWRFVDRVAWWHEYQAEVPMLFGHYWRWWDPAVHPTFSKGEPQFFADDPIGPFMADHHCAFCVDFSAGSRSKQRRFNHDPPFHGRLAAMRWPERELVYDTDAPEPFELDGLDVP